MTRKFRNAMQTLVLLALSAICLSGPSGCGTNSSTGGQQRTDSSSTEATPVETVAVGREDLKRVSEATPAELFPYERTDLYAKIAGFLQEIRVDYGDRVKKGDVLAILSVPEMDKELEQKKANVARAEAAIRQAQEAFKAAAAGVRSAEAIVLEAEAGRTRARANYERWQSEFARVEELVSRNVIDKQTRDETLNQFKAAESAQAEVEAKVKSAKAARDEIKAKQDKTHEDVSVAQANLLVAKADRDQVEALLQYAKIVAPFDGVVTKRNLHTGAFVNPKAGEMPLLTVVRTDLLRVVVDVPEKEVRYLHKDNKVIVDLDALPVQKFEWKITRIAPVLGFGKKVRIEVEIPNPDGKFYPGMYGHASVILEDKPNALTIPSNCLGKDANGSFVWLVEDGKAKHRPVKIGLNDGKKIEITDGLKGTEEIISGTKESLREGQPVRPQRASKDTKN
jgi:HlyD family secretion protein